jgi:hypothetical protein
MSYLQAAVNKTASAVEAEAWDWLRDAVEAFYAGTNRNGISDIG